jgi:hypothetical protein
MLGTEKIESIAESLKKLVIAGKKIAPDGIGLEDIPVVINLAKDAGEIIESFKSLGEAFDEVKDVDVTEFIALVSLVNAKVKEIEAA